MVVHDTFCIIDNNGCKDNTKQNITTLAVCDTSYTYLFYEALQHTAKHDNYSRKDNTTQNKSTCGMSYFTHSTT